MKELQEMVRRWLREIEMDAAAAESERATFLQAYFQERRRRQPGTLYCHP